MSWLQDLAGKAENMLNKLDQNAAEVLQHQSEPKPEQVSPPIIKSSASFSKIERTPSRGNSMSLTSSPRKPVKFVIDPEDMSKPDLEWHDKSSETDEKGTVSSSRHSSISSKLGTGSVIEKPQTPQLPVVPKELVSTFKSDYDEVLALKIILNDVKAERDDLKLELDVMASELHDARIDNRLQELEDICSCLNDEKQVLVEKYRQLEQSNSKYIKSISELELSLSKHHQNENELREKFVTAKSEAELAVQELQQYRTRAQLTLNAKEKLIEQLKAGSKGSDATDSDLQATTNTLDLEIAQLQAEKRDLLDEVARLQDKYEQSKQYFEKLEDEMKKSVKAMEEKLAESQLALKKGTRLTQQLEDDVKSERRELETVRAEMQRQRIQFTTKLHEREQEMQRLQARQQQRKMSTASQGGDDMESRMQSLTASLVQKQTNLEAATAEKNALRLQLEKLETQYRTMSQEMRQIRPQIIQINSENETDDAKSRVPNFIQENPFDNRMARVTKRGYYLLDTVGIRLGVFMRRYPIARIIVIFYILVLHMFILLLLFSSTPN